MATQNRFMHSVCVVRERGLTEKDSDTEEETKIILQFIHPTSSVKVQIPNCGRKNHEKNVKKSFGQHGIYVIPIAVIQRIIVENCLVEELCWDNPPFFVC